MVTSYSIGRGWPSLNRPFSRRSTRRLVRRPGAFFTSIAIWTTERRDLGNRIVTKVPNRIWALKGNDSAKNESDKQNPFGNFNELLKTAQTAQARATEEAQKVQQELSQVEFEGYDEDEMVRVVISGNQEPRSVELTDNLLELEADEIEERIIDAMKEAHAKSVSGMKNRMQQLYADLGFPMPPQ